MRCTQCGSIEFMEKPILTRDGDKIVNADSFVCLNCGHVEWYVNQSELAKLKSQVGKGKKAPFGW